MIDLEKRIESAMDMYCSKIDAMHVPPRDTDIDVVLSDCLNKITELKQKLEKIESGEFVLVPKQLLGIKVSDDDTNLIDAEITQKSNELIADLLINNGEEELEMLVAKAMKLGELYERKRLQRSMVEAEPSI